MGAISDDGAIYSNGGSCIIEGDSVGTRPICDDIAASERGGRACSFCSKCDGVGAATCKDSLGDIYASSACEVDIVCPAIRANGAASDAAFTRGSDGVGT